MTVNELAVTCLFYSHDSVGCYIYILNWSYSFKEKKMNSSSSTSAETIDLISLRYKPSDSIQTSKRHINVHFLPSLYVSKEYYKTSVVTHT